LLITSQCLLINRVIIFMHVIWPVCHISVVTNNLKFIFEIIVKKGRCVGNKNKYAIFANQCDTNEFKEIVF